MYRPPPPASPFLSDDPDTFGARFRTPAQGSHGVSGVSSSFGVGGGLNSSGFPSLSSAFKSASATGGFNRAWAEGADSGASSSSLLHTPVTSTYPYRRPSIGGSAAATPAQDRAVPAGFGGGAPPTTPFTTNGFGSSSGLSGGLGGMSTTTPYTSSYPSMGLSSTPASTLTYRGPTSTPAPSSSLLRTPGTTTNTTSTPAASASAAASSTTTTTSSSATLSQTDSMQQSTSRASSLGAGGHGTGTASAASGLPSSSNGLLPPSHINFSHPDLMRISAQLARVRTYKTTTRLVTSSLCSILALLLLSYVWLVPLLPWVTFSSPWSFALPLAGGKSWTPSLTLPREWVQLGGLLIGAWLAWLGGQGLYLYATSHVPVRELEGLSERQKRLMGWSSHTGHASSSRPVTAILSKEEEDRNAARARARVQQLTAPPINATSTPAATSVQKRTNTNTPARVLTHTPIPTTSLRYLDAQVGRSPVGASQVLASPFKTRGLDSSSILDESALSAFVKQHDAQRGKNATNGVGSSDSSSANPFLSPQRAGQGYMSGGLFGMGGGGFGLSTPHTPPYATSLRDTTPSRLRTPSALASASPSATSAASSTGGSGGVPPQPAGPSRFSFSLPSHRHPLDDPRSDSDLHEHFQLQLQRMLRISPRTLDGWVRNMRVWLATQVLRPLVEQMDHVQVQLARFTMELLQQPGVGQALREEEIAGLRELVQCSSTPQLQLTTRALEGIHLLAARFPQRAEVAAWAVIDKFLSVEAARESVTEINPPPTPVSAATQAYVAQRLRALCPPGDDTLSKFQAVVPPAAGAMGMGGGMRGGFQGMFGARAGMGFGSPSAGAAAGAAASSTDARSDVQILLHVFFTHMEGMLPGFKTLYFKDWYQNTLTHATLTQGAGRSSPAGSPFSLSALSSPNSTLETSCLAQVRAPPHAPYFLVTHSTLASGAAHGKREAVKYVTEPGRASLFQALVLWVRDLPKGSRLLREFTGVIQE